MVELPFVSCSLIGLNFIRKSSIVAEIVVQDCGYPTIDVEESAIGANESIANYFVFADYQVGCVNTTLELQHACFVLSRSITHHLHV